MLMIVLANSTEKQILKSAKEAQKKISWTPNPVDRELTKNPCSIFVIRIFCSDILNQLK